MANEKKIIEISVDTSEAMRRLSEMTNSVLELEKIKKSLIKTESDYGTKLAEINAKIAISKGQIRELTKEIVANNVERHKSLQAIKAEQDRIIELQFAQKNAIEKAIDAESIKRQVAEQTSQAIEQGLRKQEAFETSMIDRLIAKRREAKLANEVSAEIRKRNGYSSDELPTKSFELEQMRVYYAELEKTSAAESKLSAQKEKAGIIDAKNALKQTGYLNQLQNEVRELEQAYMQLSQAEFENAKAGVAGTQGNTVLTNLKAQRAALADAKVAYGNHTMAVGNYGNATRGIAISMGQIANEIPNFAISARIGIMSLSNNIPMLTDAIRQLNAQNAELRAQGQPTQSVLKTLMKSIFSWQTLIAVGVSLFVAYGEQMIKWVSSLKSVSDTQRKINAEQEAFKEIVKEGASGMKEATKAVNTVSTAFNEYKSGVITAKEALAIYNKQLGDHLGTQTDINTAMDVFIQKSPAFIEATFKQALVSKYADKAADAYVAANLKKKKSDEEYSNWFQDIFVELSVNRATIQQKADETEAEYTIRFRKEREKRLKAQAKRNKNSQVAEEEDKYKTFKQLQDEAQTDLDKFLAKSMISIVDDATAKGRVAKAAKAAKLAEFEFLKVIETSYNEQVAKIKEKYAKGEIKTEIDLNQQLTSLETAYYIQAEGAIDNHLKTTKKLDENQKAELLNKKSEFHKKSVEAEIKLKREIEKIILDSNLLAKENAQFEERKAAIGVFGDNRAKLTKDQLTALAELEQQHADNITDINNRLDQTADARRRKKYEKDFGAIRDSNLKSINDAQNELNLQAGLGSLSPSAKFDEEVRINQMRQDAINADLKAGGDKLQLNRELAQSQQDLTNIYVQEYQRQIQQAEAFGSKIGEASAQMLIDEKDKGRALAKALATIGLQMLANYLKVQVGKMAMNEMANKAAIATTISTEIATTTAVAAGATAKATAQSMATPQSVLTGGIFGISQSAFLTGLIAAGLAVGLAIINSVGSTSSSSDMSSGTSSAPDNTTMRKFHSGGMSGSYADSPSTSDEITATLLKTERVLSPTQTTVFNGIINKMSDSGSITKGVGLATGNETAVLVAALTKAISMMPSPIVTVKDIDLASSRVSVIDAISTYSSKN